MDTLDKKKALPELQKLPDGFYIEPLRNRVMNILRQKDQMLAAALGTDVSDDFGGYLRSSLDRNENIILAAGGRTRSGKSYAMLELSLQVAEYTGIPFTVNNICWHDSQFMSHVKKAKFKEWFLIDETEDSAYGAGASAEESYIEDFNRICAKKCINRVNVVGDYSTSTDKAIYKLISLARDIKRRVTRFLLYSIEAGENLPLGFVDIELEHTTCPAMKRQKGLQCITCDRYAKCKEFIAEYEKFKDTNISRISEGGHGSKQSVRQDERELAALGIAQDPNFATCTSKDVRRVFVRSNYHKYTNRELTEGEIREIGEYAYWLNQNNMTANLAKQMKGETKDREKKEPKNTERRAKPKKRKIRKEDQDEINPDERKAAIEKLKERGED